MSQRILNRRRIARFKRQEAPIPVEEDEEDSGISVQGAGGYRAGKRRPQTKLMRRRGVSGQTLPNLGLAPEARAKFVTGINKGIGFGNKAANTVRALLGKDPKESPVMLAARTKHLSRPIY